MGFFSRLAGSPHSGSAGSIGVPSPVTPANAPEPANERAIRDAHRPRREAARRHYKATGDSGPMWRAKKDEVDAINDSRRR